MTVGKHEIDFDAVRDARFSLGGEHEVTVTIEPEDHRQEPQVCLGRLLDLSRSGARFRLPLDVPVANTLRVKIALSDLGMEFYVGASVCWTKPDDSGFWQLGCLLNPAIPAGLFERLSRGGRIDRRDTPRAQRTLNVPVFWELAGQRVEGVLQNYSRGGFCVLVDRPGKPGQRLQVQLEGEQTLVVVAESEWQLASSEGYFVGCSFSNSRGFERLDEFCQEPCNRPSP
jgi:hypothetical protein